MKIMSLLMAGYVLLGSLFPRTDFSQLARVVNAGHHYRAHLQEARESGDEMSFGEFWKVHYLQPALHQGEHEQDHCNLPFHSIVSFIFHNLGQPVQPLVVRPPALEAAGPAFENRLHLTGFPTSVFIPPSLF